MAKMSRHQFTAGLIAAALAFRQQSDDDAEKARLKALATGSEELVNDDEDEEDLWEHFQGFVEVQGIPKTMGNPDIECIAGLNKGEPSFVLRGQDILASVMVRHWISVYEALAPNAVQSKIADAEGIAEKMEMYGKQKWAD